MSGGFFNYDQWKLENIADQIERIIENNGDETLDDYGYRRGRDYAGPQSHQPYQPDTGQSAGQEE